MLDNGEPGCVRPQSTGFVESGLASTGAVSLPPGHCRWKPLPRMSQEMINVMSSFNMIDISTKNASPKGRKCHDDDIEHNELEGKGYCGVQKSSLVKSKNPRTMKTVGVKPTQNKAGRLPNLVKLPPMKAGAQKHNHSSDIDKKDARAPLTTAPNCSPVTRRLLARSSAVFGHIDNVRENAKLACSVGRRSSEGKLDSVATKLFVDSNKNYYSTSEEDNLDGNAFRSKTKRSVKQRSLEESTSDSQEEQSWYNLPMPFGKTRSATIS